MALAVLELATICVCKKANFPLCINEMLRAKAIELCKNPVHHQKLF